MGKKVSRESVLNDNIIIQPCFRVPEDTKEDEVWAAIPENEYTVGLQDYYRISNYGRILNTKTGKVLHMYQRLGYQYCTLNMRNKYKLPGQGNNDRRNFTLADLLLYTFRPVEDALSVKPIYLGDRSDVYVDKMVDGKLDSNIKWGPCEKESSQRWFFNKGVSKADAHKICQLLEFGWSINRISLEMPHVLPRTIADIYRRRLFLEISRLYDF